MMRRLTPFDRWRPDTRPRTAWPGADGKPNPRGVALVVTLLLLFMMSVLGLAAVLSTSSDALINGYYGNYRGSFYAADSGLTIARQNMQSYIMSLVPNGTTWSGTWTTCTTGNPQPISSVAYSNPYSSATNLTGSNATSPASVKNSWPESFTITRATLTLPTPANGGCTVTLTGNGSPYYTYTFTYNLTSVGTASGTEQASVSENGSFVLHIGTVGGTAPANTSFSAFGAFINNFPPCWGPLVYGTLSGPLYAASTTNCPNGVTNCGEWNLGSGGSYTFTAPVNQTGSKFSYYVGSTCTQSASVPFTSGHTTISPNFQAGYNLSQSIVPLPGNDYSQRWAVLDGLGCGENNGNQCGNLSSPAPLAPTPQQMNSYNLQNANQHNAAASPYATVSGSTYTPATSGVYIPYTCSGATCSLTSTAGGIYVEDSSGAATTVTLTAATSGMFTGATFPTSTQCTAAACQVVQVAQQGNSTTGSSSVSAGSTSCTSSTHHGSTTYTCTATYTKTTPTNTPTNITSISIDPTSNVTTASSYVQTSTSTLTQTATSTCTGSSACTPSAPSSNSYGNDSTSNSTSNGTATNLTLSGVPTMSTSLGTPSTVSCTAAGSGACAETMIYVDGSTNVTGPSSGAAVQNNSMLSIVANGNIQQTGNLTYATAPVTTSGSTVDQLNTLPANASYQVLGLYTSVGEFQMNPPNNGGNLETDAAIAVISGASTCTPSNNCGMIATPGNGVGTWTNVGGRSENSINGVSINTGNVYYDKRFTSYKSFGPPWFPQTVIATQDLTNVQVTNEYPNVQRVQWYTSTGGQ